MAYEAVQFPDGEAYKYQSMWKDDINAERCILLRGDKAREAVAAHIRRQLKRDIKPGKGIKVVQVKANQFRVFIAVTRDRKATISEVTSLVADLCGHRTSQSGAIVMGGGGYSKSFEIVYRLGRMLWPNGTRQPHGMRNGEPDRDGGYALNEI